VARVRRDTLAEYSLLNAALPLIATAERTRREVRKVPQPAN
jgi:hypothetical protein